MGRGGQLSDITSRLLYKRVFGWDRAVQGFDARSFPKRLLERFA